MSTKSDDIRTQVGEILKTAGMGFSAIYVGQRKRDEWDCDAWVCPFTDGGASVFETFEFYTGLGLRTKIEDTARGRLTAQHLKGSHHNSLAWEAARKEHCKPQAPHAADVLYSLILDSSAVGQSFNDWCSDFGYDTDSRKAERIYHACQEGADKLSRVFNAEQRKALQTALEGY